MQIHMRVITTTRNKPIAGKTKTNHKVFRSFYDPWFFSTLTQSEHGVKHGTDAKRGKTCVTQVTIAPDWLENLLLCCDWLKHVARVF